MASTPIINAVRDPSQNAALFPAIEPDSSGRLDVGDGHQIYFETSGNPQGKPAVFVHGGPGSGAGSNARRFFDPEKFRIVVFDQRGCGRSTPHASLENNTTWDLVADMERLRERLDIDQWLVFGGSWGSTLSLAYAQAHPERVSELVLRGIFMLRQRELAWFYQHGASELFPDAWQQYLAPIPEHERDDLIAAFHRRLTHADAAIRLAAARAWAVWEAATSFLYPSEDFKSALHEPEAALAMARIECHYFVHHGFLEHEDQLLDGVDRIRHISAVIVQSRYDVVCPMTTAWDLHQRWPEAEFEIIPNAGHSAFDEPVTRALVAATNRFAG